MRTSFGQTLYEDRSIVAGAGQQVETARKQQQLVNASSSISSNEGVDVSNEAPCDLTRAMAPRWFAERSEPSTYDGAFLGKHIFSNTSAPCEQRVLLSA